MPTTEPELEPDLVAYKAGDIPACDAPDTMSMGTDIGDDAPSSPESVALPCPGLEDLDLVSRKASCGSASSLSATAPYSLYAS